MAYWPLLNIPLAVSFCVFLVKGRDWAIASYGLSYVVMSVGAMFFFDVEQLGGLFSLSGLVFMGMMVAAMHYGKI